MLEKERDNLSDGEWASRRLVTGFLTALLVIVAGLQIMGKQLGEFSINQAAIRQLTHICQALTTGRVTQEELCQKQVIHIPYFSRHYELIREKDEAWFQKHGWLYYPETLCDSHGLRFKFTDKEFICRGETPEEAAAKD